MSPGVGVVGQAVGLEQAVGHVDAHAVGPAVEPEPQGCVHELARRRVPPVPVGLLGSVEVEVPLAGPAVGLRHPGPGGATEDAGPVVRRQLARCAAAREEVEARPLLAAGTRGQGCPECRVLGRAMVGDQVDDDPQSQPVGRRHQGVEVIERAEQRVDIAVVADVVAVVRLRRALERRQPDGVGAEPRDVLEPAGCAAQVPHSVAVGVDERSRVDLVDHRRAPPSCVVCTHAPESVSASGHGALAGSALGSARPRPSGLLGPPGPAPTRPAASGLLAAGESDGAAGPTRPAGQRQRPPPRRAAPRRLPSAPRRPTP